MFPADVQTIVYVVTASGVSLLSRNVLVIRVIHSPEAYICGEARLLRKNLSGFLLFLSQSGLEALQHVLNRMASGQQVRYGGLALSPSLTSQLKSASFRDHDQDVQPVTGPVGSQLPGNHSLHQRLIGVIYAGRC